MYLGSTNSELLKWIRANQGSGFVKIDAATQFTDFPSLQRRLDQSPLKMQECLTQLVCHFGILEFSDMGYRILEIKDRPVWNSLRANSDKLTDDQIQEHKVFKANYLALTT